MCDTTGAAPVWNGPKTGSLAPEGGQVNKKKCLQIRKNYYFKAIRSP